MALLFVLLEIFSYKWFLTPFIRKEINFSSSLIEITLFSFLSGRPYIRIRTRIRIRNRTRNRIRNRIRIRIHNAHLV